jgi:hypothetical protein
MTKKERTQVGQPLIYQANEQVLEFRDHSKLAL